MNPTVPPTATLANLRLRTTEEFVERLLERAPDYRPTVAAFRRDLEQGAWHEIPAVRDTYYVLATLGDRRLVLVVALRDGALHLVNATVPSAEWERRFAAHEAAWSAGPAALAA